MSRYLVTVFPVLRDDYREKIRDAAEQYGFTALFYDSPAEAAHMRAVSGSREITAADTLYTPADATTIRIIST